MKQTLRIVLQALTGALVVVALAGVWGWQEMDSMMQRPLALIRPVLITITPGSNLTRIAADLEREGFVTHRWLFALRARLDGVAHRLKAGTYEINDGETPTQILAALVAGRTRVFQVTFIEGCRFDDMRRTLGKAPHLVHTLTDVSDSELARALGLPVAALEGKFFPSTYQYEAGTEDRLILARAQQRMQQILDRLWTTRQSGLPYKSAYEALIMASIIEKETGQADERPAIAGVFLRRLVRGMKLQTDPTVIYGLGAAFDGNLTRADLTRDTPYNSYTRGGLPPTPIAMPGEAALNAALNPATGDALYFVAKGDGGHQFSNSLHEHNAAVRRYQLKR